MVTSFRIDCPPEDYLRAAGSVFAVFDQQDSGNVSFGVELQGARYFVKTAGDPDLDPAHFGREQRWDLLRNAARIGATYRHPAVPRLLKVGESPHGPVLVYDWADGELLHVAADRRDDPTSASRRFRSLPVERIAAALDTVVDVHDLLGRAGEVAGDFYDGCLIYDFAAHRLSLIDLDHYRPGRYLNQMGRMFGSSRFMAPEEFVKGATIDQRTSVFTLGRAVLVMLGDGTTDQEKFRGPAALRTVAVRACQPLPEDRQRDLAEFSAEWRAARSSSPGVATTTDA